MHVSTTTAQTPKFRLLLPDYRRRGLLPLLVRESTPVSKITRKHNELSSACKAAVQLRDGSVRLQTGRGARGRSKSRIRCSNRHNTKRAGSGPLDRSANVGEKHDAATARTFWPQRTQTWSGLSTGTRLCQQSFGMSVRSPSSVSPLDARPDPAPCGRTLACSNGMTATTA